MLFSVHLDSVLMTVCIVGIVVHYLWIYCLLGGLGNQKYSLGKPRVLFYRDSVSVNDTVWGFPLTSVLSLF